MADIAPIRMLDETAALEWLRSQPGGRTNLPAAELSRRWGWARHRAGRRLKAWAKAGLVTRRGNTVKVADGAQQKAPRQHATNNSQHLDDTSELRDSVAPLVSPPGAALDSVARHAADVTAYMAAIGLASVAALFSVKGMVQLFPGTPVLIIAMATMMEASKLIAAGWLARRWRVTVWSPIGATARVAGNLTPLYLWWTPSCG